MEKLIRKVSRALFNYDPKYEDAFSNVQGKFFAPLYLERMRPYLERHAQGRPLKILDAGCQVGRLALPLAKAGHEVVAADPSRFALRMGERYARRQGFKLTWVASDIRGLSSRCSPATFDVVLCAEVLYLNQDHDELFRLLLNLLKPGGLTIISHRTKRHYVQEALSHRDFAAAKFALEHGEGPFRGDAFYKWHTLDELRTLYAQHRLEILGAHPIGAFTTQVSPDQLSEDERAQLLDLERRADLAGAPDCARYVLVIARTSPDGHQAP